MKEGGETSVLGSVYRLINQGTLGFVGTYFAVVGASCQESIIEPLLLNDGGVFLLQDSSQVLHSDLSRWVESIGGGVAASSAARMIHENDVNLTSTFISLVPFGAELEPVIELDEQPQHAIEIRLGNCAMFGNRERSDSVRCQESSADHPV